MPVTEKQLWEAARDALAKTVFHKLNKEENKQEIATRYLPRLVRVALASARANPPGVADAALLTEFANFVQGVVKHHGTKDLKALQDVSGKLIDQAKLKLNTKATDDDLKKVNVEWGDQPPAFFLNPLPDSMVPRPNPEFDDPELHNASTAKEVAEKRAAAMNELKSGARTQPVSAAAPADSKDTKSAPTARPSTTPGSGGANTTSGSGGASAAAASASGSGGTGGASAASGAKAADSKMTETTRKRVALFEAAFKTPSHAKLDSSLSSLAMRPLLDLGLKMMCFAVWEAEKAIKAKNSRCHGRLVWWFGEANVQSASDNITKMAEALRKVSVTIALSSAGGKGHVKYLFDPKVGAPVHAGSGTKLYLMATYKASTVIDDFLTIVPHTMCHELSHAAAGTQDVENAEHKIAYGKVEALKLAQKKPSNAAAQNADNYALFLMDAFIPDAREILLETFWDLLDKNSQDALAKKDSTKKA